MLSRTAEARSRISASMRVWTRAFAGMMDSFSDDVMQVNDVSSPARAVACCIARGSILDRLNIAQLDEDDLLGPLLPDKIEVDVDVIIERRPTGAPDGADTPDLALIASID